MTTAVEHVKALYGLSRGTQAALSVAQPLVAMLLADTEPAPGRLAMAVAGAFAGFFAVFAANDLLDAHLDRRRAEGADGRAAPLPHGAAPGPEGRVAPDLDGAGARHPLAGERLSFAVALTWVLGLSAVALMVAAALSWVCVLLFVVAALLEAVYCRLATVTAYKCVLSGVMVAVGASAGWFAFTDRVDPLRLGLFALWMAAWETGGRNIPNDLADLADDAPLGIRTVPVVHGPRRSAVLAFALLVLAALSAGALAVVTVGSFGTAGLVGTLLAGAVTLVVPGLRLLRRPESGPALSLFNRASFHPVCVLAAFIAALALS
ncbi:UbiA family prenyltransferase [Streptomyces axinellae]|uniref:Ubiquinone biosynthesis protein UbiA n=1 Tax=Streptomyces axinellae TaxID=552788 RepID=A0ABN3Q0V3_9ACTN